MLCAIMRFAEYSVDGSTKIRVPPFLSKRRNSLKINPLFQYQLCTKKNGQQLYPQIDYAWEAIWIYQTKQNKLYLIDF